MEPPRIDTATRRIAESPGLSFLPLWILGGVAAISLIGAIVWFIVANSRDASPSERAAEQAAALRSKGGLIGQLAEMNAPKGSLNVTIEGTPTIEYGHAYRFGEVANWHNIRLTMRLKNESSKPVSAIGGAVRLVEPGRSFDYGSRDFRIDVAGGIEPGETVTVSKVMMAPDSESTEWDWAVDIERVFSGDSIFTTPQSRSIATFSELQ